MPRLGVSAKDMVDGAGDAVSTDRTRVWFPTAALSVGGAERRLIDIANGIDPARYEPTVLALFDHHLLATELAEDGETGLLAPPEPRTVDRGPLRGGTRE